MSAVVAQIITVQLVSNHNWHFGTFQRQKDNFSKNKEGSSARATAQLNISFLLIEMHKYHVTVHLPPQLQLCKRGVKWSWQWESWESKRDFDYDNFETRSIFEHIQITVAPYLDFIQVSRWDFIFGILNSLEAGRIMLSCAKLGKLFYYFSKKCNNSGLFHRPITSVCWLRKKWNLMFPLGRLDHCKKPWDILWDTRRNMEIKWTTIFSLMYFMW